MCSLSGCACSWIWKFPQQPDNWFGSFDPFPATIDGCGNGLDFVVSFPMDGSQRQNRESITEQAAKLPWLCPSSFSLERLAAEPTPIGELSADPAIVLLALRFHRPSLTPQTFRFAYLRDSIVAEAAARLLESPSPYWLNTEQPKITSVMLRARGLSQAARRYSEANLSCHPDAAAAIGLLAPLGELAWVTVEPTMDCPNPTAIARRLSTRWRLPEWVAATIVHANLPLADAIRLGADPELSRMLRVIQPDPIDFKQARSEDPHTLRLLPELLRATARSRRTSNEHRLRAAESEVERLHELLSELRDDFEIAVRDSKLSGLAELAAGAGHEINNPLAIISGHVQRLRKTEFDPDRLKTFDVLLRQTERISDIVRELMQFARPAAPNRSMVDPRLLADELIGELEQDACQRRITIIQPTTDSAASIECDANQLKRILRNLLRNAIEASPDGGQIRVKIASDSDYLQLTVEDDGAGPRDEAIPHLFDPFYSDRMAGRGRGLGLATAWRLATINGGELRYQREPGGPTQFVLEFARSKPHQQPLRIPA